MKTLLVVLFAALMVVGGCASRQSLTDAVLEARKTGSEEVTRSYKVSVIEAWYISEAVFRWIKVDRLDEHRSENYMIASSGMELVAFGTVMGVWLEPAGQDSTIITVITKNRGDCCPLADLTPDRFFEKFQRGVDIVKAGSKLPETSP